MFQFRRLSVLFLLTALMLGCSAHKDTEQAAEETTVNVSTPESGGETTEPTTPTETTDPAPVEDPQATIEQPTETKRLITRSMATRSLTVTPPALIPATGAEATPETSSESEPKVTEAATPEEKTDQDADAYKVVKVFYGTDRNVTTGITSNPLSQIPWTLLAMITGGLMLLTIVICIFKIRGKKAVLIPVLLLLTTAGFGVTGVLFPYESKPEIAKTDVAYGSERGEFELGTCEVSIPQNHKLAELEAPSVFNFEINEDPTKHVVLLGIDRLEEGPFMDDLRETISTSQGEEAFVFVHGYNVTFENAARRTAQLAYDLDFKGAPIFYSWPSQGNLLKYTVDEENVNWSVPHLKQFLRLIAEQSNAKRVHLIAHSMGNRALTSALKEMSYTDAKNGPIFNEVILTAPDVDADTFRRDLAPRIIKTAQRVTLYASSNDEALIASKKVHGSPRAGESGEAVVVVPGIDTIDVSQLDTSLLGHSYYGSNDTVLVDMAQLLLESKPPTLRSRLHAMTLNGLSYWAFLVENLRAELKDRTGTAR